MKEFICDNISQSDNGRLCFAGRDTTELAEKYGTPLYLFDEDKIREKCRTYINAVKKAFGDKGIVLYASKAASFKRIVQIAFEEGLNIDVVSPGEINTALKAGVPGDKMWFHGNNKTDWDIDYAMSSGVGCFVVDNAEELYVIDEIAPKHKKTQNVILRITPGIDPHTFEAVATGKVDSKFGTAIVTGQALEITKTALSLKNINLLGFHCHVGSQCFDSQVFFDAVDVMFDFIACVKKETGFEAKIFNIGGGYGVKYVETDAGIDIASNIQKVGEHAKKAAEKVGIKMPVVAFEPGRSIAADAGMTLYTAGTVKRITGYKNYVSVDGGMTDNIRFALYGSEYTVYNAGRMNEECDMMCSVVGRCCESGDIIQENVKMPSSTKRGDIIAVCTTGAYNYSMASNYNRIPRPPVVMLSNGQDYIAVKRETIDDIVRLDI
ncbi:MAG: diaminopimelate decarboxylase [Clostridiales bacterium]|nr:diaminopimelate decarboxylase [Clostridiales bacterium]